MSFCLFIFYHVEQLLATGSWVRLSNQTRDRWLRCALESGEFVAIWCSFEAHSTDDRLIASRRRWQMARLIFKTKTKNVLTFYLHIWVLGERGRKGGIRSDRRMWATCNCVHGICAVHRSWTFLAETVKIKKKKKSKNQFRSLDLLPLRRYPPRC